jgi:hypothetical protein
MNIDSSYQNSVCKIVCGKDTGSGFLVSKDRILTAEHVISESILGQKEIIITFLEANKREYKAELLAHEHSLDIAILKIEEISSLSPLKLMKYPIQYDSKWESFGFPATETGQLAGDNLEGTIKRNISKHVDTKHDVELYCMQFSPQFIYEGFSGSPVLDENGFVIAILRERLNRSLGATSILKLYSFLQKNQIEIEIDYEKFETKPFSRNWFIEHSEKIINSAGPRYTYYANVKLDYDKFFDAIARNKDFQTLMKTNYGEIKKKLSKISFRTNGELQEINSKIQTAIAPLCAEIEKANKLSIDKQVNWRNINDLAHDCYKQVDDELTKLYNLNKNNKPTNISSGKYDYEIREVRELLNSIYKNIMFSSSLQADLSNDPFLLIKGEAGQGKTHLLCDIAVNRIERDEPTLMFFGQHFTLAEPWQQIISSLELKLNKTEFLERLNDLGARKEKKSLIFVDALNEGAGKELWTNQIDSFISDIKKYPWIGLVISIRTPFEKAIIPEHLINDKVILEINHVGFKGNEYKAVREYFNYYGIELFSVPILDNEFSNPLFLKTFCEAFKKKGYYRLPKGAQKFSFVFNLFIEQKNLEISKKIDADPKLKILNKALNVFAETFVKSDLRGIEREKAHKICENIINSRTWSNSLLFHMISEGVLLESMIFDTNVNAWIETIDFAYERFSDFIKADYLSEFFKTGDLSRTIIQNIFSNDKLLYYETVIHALSVILPEKYNKEVYEYFPEFANHKIIAGSFFESLIWRSYDALDDQKISEYKNQLTKAGIDYTADFLNVLLTVSSDPNHIYNANYLHKKLWDLEVAKRDLEWTVQVFHWYKENDKTIIDSYIDWAWSDEDKSHIDDDALSLSSIILAWFLTSSNRFLRDDATKALVGLLKNRPKVLIELLEKFNKVNDLYVAERLYAVAYGCVLISNDKELIKIIAGKVYELVFSDNNPPVHFLLRDYARNCIERANYLGIELDVNLNNIQPPYNSNWIEPITEQKAKKYKIEWDKDKKPKNEEIAQYHLYDSIMGFEDFARYVIGTNHGITNWTLISLKHKQAYQSLKKSLRGKAKSLLNSYKDLIKNKYRFENSPQHTRKMIGEEFISTISDSVKMIEKQLIEVLSQDEKTILISSVNSYLHSIYNKVDDNSFDLSIIQRFIIQKVYELGWSQEYFGNFDFYVNRYTEIGREARKKERIGKKYQWIALYEILARLADNYEYKVKYNDDGYEICQGPWHNKFYRDIDPDILIREPLNVPLPQFVGIFENDYELNTSVSNEDWLKITNDFPLIENLFEIIDIKGDKWLKLEGNYSWIEEASPDKDEYQQPRKEIWLQIRSYLVNRSKKDTFYKWAKQQDFMGRWMPESHDRIEYYLRESYWAPSYRYTKQPYYGYEKFHNPAFENTKGKVSAKIMITTENFLKEVGSSIYDCSMDEGLSIKLPCEFIVKKMQLSFGEREGYLFDNNNNLIAFDPSVWDNGKGGLLIKKDEFLKFLNDNNLSIVFTILGEKWILGTSHLEERFTKRIEISGAYTVNDKYEIEGEYTLRHKE